MAKVKEYGPMDERFTWINLPVDDLDDLLDIGNTYGISEEMLAYASDKNERARLEYDDDTDTLLIIFNIANKKKVNYHYETLPMTFIIRNNVLLTFAHEDNDYVIQLMKHYIHRHSDEGLYKFLFSSLFLIVKEYFPLVEEMDRERNLLTKELRSRTTRKNLFNLSDLETGIAYFRTGARQNEILLEQFRSPSLFKRLDGIDIEELDDAVIEAKQLVEMTELSWQILDRLSDTYNNVLNNNLNETMRILTVLSILLTVPTIVTGFYGMNMDLPFVQSRFSWVFALIISALGWWILARILKRFFDKH
ncbi:magnesium transporter CorA family protein [Aerococcus urinae]|uniref:Magnesium transporter CorA family protein n=1 Tax=Aerococcus urinae TaxID=1376 RepID=A0A0X8FFW5_9LACT|nr:magnesium transporter CorA family protein [Aerococcus urinae]AMB96572.1 magnesium transporter CorA [Aerococcus urinae]MCY3032969.1 magnesium transporter CorA family protein [Aerococcus urinae]MCY3038113.1 magnesium transporter CorA family protein [Aerococcus urinae]MCY3045015.1 magnesium transporter CorA family protein [Aerococcus urinae]MCY3046175.1 magnesium transporter CorA family protein [Aerococcus urinae]